MLGFAFQTFPKTIPRFPHVFQWGSRIALCTLLIFMLNLLITNAFHCPPMPRQCPQNLPTNAPPMQNSCSANGNQCKTMQNQCKPMQHECNTNATPMQTHAKPMQTHQNQCKPMPMPVSHFQLFGNWPPAALGICTDESDGVFILL